MRVLYISNMINTGGVAAVVKMIAKNCCAIDSNINADVICYEEPSKNTIEELSAYNIKVIVVDRVTRNPFRYVWKISKILKNTNYDAIHSHIEYFNWIPCLLGKLHGVKNRVGHAHGQKGRSNSFIFHMVEKIGRLLNRKTTTKRFACSIASGNYVFGKNDFEFLPNFIGAKKELIISDSERQRYMIQLSITKKQVVIGFMGYLGYEKNPSFVIELAKYSTKIGKNYRFLIAGDGIEKDRLIKESQECIDNGTVQFLGYRNDSINLLQMFDVLIMPSFSEGMSMALLESQIYGTPCVVSNGVPTTTDLGIGLFYQAKSFSCEEWISLIDKCLRRSQNRTFDERVEHLKEIGYDGQTIIKRIISSYKEN